MDLIEELLWQESVDRSVALLGGHSPAKKAEQFSKLDEETREAFEFGRRIARSAIARGENYAGALAALADHQMSPAMLVGWKAEMRWGNL